MNESWEMFLDAKVYYLIRRMAVTINNVRRHVLSFEFFLFFSRE